MQPRSLPSSTVKACSKMGYAYLSKLLVSNKGQVRCKRQHSA